MFTFGNDLNEIEKKKKKRKKKNNDKTIKDTGVVDQGTDGPTDRLSDTATHRDFSNSSHFIIG